MNEILIDGSHEEGGGQILRTAIGLSVLTGKPVRIINIRKGRPKPGLRPGHLAGLDLLRQFSNADTTGLAVGSTEVTFRPGLFRPFTTTYDIGTAGSITLLLQSLMIPCFVSKKRFRLTVKGGTDVPFSIPADYMVNVILPYYNLYRETAIRILRRGYYPKGDGEIEVSFRGMTGFGGPLLLVRNPKILNVRGICHASSELIEKAEKLSFITKSKLRSLNAPVNMFVCAQDTPSDGYGITLWVQSGSEFDYQIIGADSLANPKIPVTQTAQDVTQKLEHTLNIRGCIDEHLADNMLPYLALKGGSMMVPEFTGHIRSNIYVIEQFLGPVFSIKGNIIEVMQAG